MNLDTYIFDKEAEERGEFIEHIPLPYVDLKDLPPDELQRLIEGGHVAEFSHSLEAQIGEQLKAGFVETEFFEDRWDGMPEPGLSRYMPTLFATRAATNRLDTIRNRSGPLVSCF